MGLSGGNDARMGQWIAKKKARAIEFAAAR
jgi:hypothetical protein